jgi:hypothetical protein
MVCWCEQEGRAAELKGLGRHSILNLNEHASTSTVVIFEGGI